MSLEDIQNALFAAYDLRNAMTTEEKYQPTEGDTYGECITLIVQTLEQLEIEMERGMK